MSASVSTFTTTTTTTTLACSEIEFLDLYGPAYSLLAAP